MDWNAIGAIGEIVGAAAVVTTLIVLIAQIRVSNRLAQSAAADQIMSAARTVNDKVLDNPYIAELLVKLQDEKSEYTPTEGTQITYYCYKLFSMWVQIHTAYINGQVSEEFFEGFRQDVIVHSEKYPGLIPYFSDLLKGYPVWDLEFLKPLKSVNETSA